MGLHKLTAGDGYLYLIRQVAAADGTERARASLADYYSSKGESPGRWMGRGLAALGKPVSRDSTDPLVAKLWGVPEASEVTEAQMKALFGSGLHPNAEQITGHLTAHGVAEVGAAAAARLGRAFPISHTENRFIARLTEAYRAYNTTAGAPAQASVPPEIRARIRTALAREMFTETHARPPADERELTGFVATQSRAPSNTVAGFDLTFTPVKSVSTLWALAPAPIANTIEECHHQAVAETLRFLEDNAAFSRMGTGGVAHVDTTGLIVAAFDHRDSRAGDPNLHTHAAVSNKVCAIGPDGIPRWLALDGATLYRAKVAASEFYNTRIEALLIDRVQVRFAERAAQAGKRTVREIVGVPAALNEKFSSRRAAIEGRVGDLIKQFQLDHGREPTMVEMLALSQQATLETRAAKHEPRSLAEQLHQWLGQAIEVLGSARAVADMVAEVTAPLPQHQVEITETWIAEQAAAVIATVAEHRATWTINHVRAEAQRRLRYANHPGGVDLVERITAAALGHSISLTSHADTEMNEPAPLRRRDGASVYSRHDSTVYTSAEIMAAERRILAAAGRRDGRTVDADSIGLALLEVHANTGVELNDAQRAMVHTMAASGARVQLTIAPAGAGKTTAMAPLAAAWRSSGGTVIGLAPQASASELLARDLGAPTDTIAKLVHLAGGTAPADDPAWRWYDAINADTLIIVDEAGKASTPELDTVISVALARGASLRLVGDDRQLSSISAGGILRDLAELHGALTLPTVVRFTHPVTGKAEAAASLALREGDPAGIGFYIDHHRVHVGADHSAADLAYAAWAADRAAGRDSILLAPDNDTVATLNERARLDRLTTLDPNDSAAAVTVTLSDGLCASAGDTITTRKNNRYLFTHSDGTWVKNGHRWTIREVHDDGSLTVIPLRGRATAVRLPARYVATHTTLGYASTIDVAQGMTAGGRDTEGTCHTVINDRLTRQQLYVALTRGRTENHVYASTVETDPHRILTPKATHPPTAVDLLSTIVGRDGAQQSAHTVAALDADPFTRLHGAAAMYTDALTAAAEHLAGPAVMAGIDAAAAAIRAELPDAGAWPVLRRSLALLAIDGYDPIAALHRAAATDLGDPHDLAAVLQWRLPTPAGSAAARVGPLQWLPDIPDTVRAHPSWGPYLTKRAKLVADLAAQVRHSARSSTPTTVPDWARPLRERRPALMAEIAVFRAAHGVDPADTRTAGPPQHPRRSAAIQRLIHERLDASMTRAADTAGRWRHLAERTNTGVTRDPFWPRLAAHLDDAARAGADVAALLGQAITTGGPLPDEMPAAALWWRLAGTLSPPVLDGTDTTLRPPWTAHLHHLLGTRIAEAVITDPAWPSLVAAVAASDWAPADLLAAAAEHQLDIAADTKLRPDQYARLLTYRIELLTHHAATIDPDIPHPAEHSAAQRPAPAVGDQLDLFDDYHPDGLDGLDDDLTEPPPDPYDYPYCLAENELHGLDFDDLPRHRPHTTGPVEDIDIGALRARRDAATQDVQELQEAILSGGGGPAERAAAELAELHRRHQQQRPLQHALARAHHLWVDAEGTATLHASLLTRLQAAITAAAARGDDQAVARFQQHHHDVTQQGPQIDAAVQAARARLDTARQALLDAAGGVEGIVTERHIHDRRAHAVRADNTALNHARRHARDLNDQLARAETAAARALTDNPLHSYDLAAELPEVRAEIAFLDAAGAASPATILDPPEAALAHLDDAHRRAVTAIATNIHTVQPLRLHPRADKPAALAALAATAHHDQRTVLALTATAQANAYAAEHPYADTTTDLSPARTDPDNHHVSVPRRGFIIVDDADHLSAENLLGLTRTAQAANTKVILLTTVDDRRPTHTLLAALHQNAPNAQHLGTPDPRRSEPRTAIERAEHYLAATNTPSPSRDEAIDLLRQRTQILDRLREMADATRRIDEVFAELDRGIDRGLEL
ncbi:MobF family relaxase [Mycobacterium asiaticum]|uniref:Exonuclease V subunit alpha n=1 Tax=Mycobacterium asiaticum TaxID=1790 RepID=A0A1A3KZR5_MYCAS|nr:MobF family relaxase [Mycobacterium asiaticum]OBJ89853.1 exonuclease V subunit alpha [Mycobacterium asiaticum]